MIQRHQIFEVHRKALGAIVAVVVIGAGGVFASRFVSPVAADSFRAEPGEHVQTTVHRDYYVNGSIESMIADAAIIIRGRINRPLRSWNLRRNPDNVAEEAAEISPGTDYEVSVDRYLKGTGPNTLIVTLSGGTYGGVTEQPEHDIETGREYILFLDPVQFAEKEILILGSSPGHFRIEGDMAIAGHLTGIPHNIPSLPLADLAEQTQNAQVSGPRPQPQETPETPSPLPGHAELNGSDGSNK